MFSAVLCAGVACDSAEPEEPSEAPAVAEALEEEIVPEPEVHPIWGSWESDGLLSELDGRAWVVGHGEQEDRWEFDGDKVRYTEHGRETLEGTVENVRPGVVAVVTEEGGGTMRRFFSLVRQEGEIFLGMGMSGAVMEDRILVESRRGMIVYRDGECRLHDTNVFGDYDEEGAEMSCEIVEDGEGRLFTFTRPDGSQITANQGLLVGEEFLADGQLRRNRLVLAED